jgi:hypothetical protein
MCPGFSAVEFDPPSQIRLKKEAEGAVLASLAGRPSD